MGQAVLLLAGKHAQREAEEGGSAICASRSSVSKVLYKNSRGSVELGGSHKQWGQC
jgi:hypothetical protein